MAGPLSAPCRRHDRAHFLIAPPAQSRRNKEKTERERERVFVWSSFLGALCALVCPFLVLRCMRWLGHSLFDFAMHYKKKNQGKQEKRHHIPRGHRRRAADGIATTTEAEGTATMRSPRATMQRHVLLLRRGQCASVPQRRRGTAFGARFPMYTIVWIGDWEGKNDVRYNAARSLVLLLQQAHPAILWWHTKKMIGLRPRWRRLALDARHAPRQFSQGSVD